MKKIKHFLAKPIVTVLLLVMAVGLLLGSGVQGTRAALNYYSDTYQSRLSKTIASSLPATTRKTGSGQAMNPVPC